MVYTVILNGRYLRTINLPTAAGYIVLSVPDKPQPIDEKDTKQKPISCREVTFRRMYYQAGQQVVKRALYVGEVGELTAAKVLL